MINPVRSIMSAAKRQPLAACIAALLALAAPEAMAANTWNVTNCADSGAGSLRDIVTNSAVSGDTVDLSHLNASNCPGSTISLVTGAIAIPQQTLALSGPSSRITITGYYNGAYMNDRLVNHTGSGGTLSLTNLNFWYSRFSPASGNAYGGCIRSSGSVLLSSSSVFQCHLTGTSTRTQGGGIWAQNDVTLKYSQVTANSVVDAHSAPAAGGIMANGNFTATYSTVSGNNAQFGNVGGVYVGSGATLTNSTISGNSAGFAGGMQVLGNASKPVKISNSTISGNSSTGYVGGLSLLTSSATIQNSTIAFNTAVDATPDASPGVYFFNGSATPSSTTIDIESSILSNNTYGVTENDIGAKASNAGTIFSITSNNNIIRAAPGTFRPPTVSTDCPLLGPLRSNGGATQTHALLSHSPAINAGNNNANRNEDQRGEFADPNNPYPYPRVSGVAADIGAYEVQQSDIIFNASFEGCPALF